MNRSYLKDVKDCLIRFNEQVEAEVKQEAINRIQEVERINNEVIENKDDESSNLN